AYPRLKLKYFQEGYLNYFLSYEPFYLGGFMMLEWLFRGLLVIGMVKYLGHRAILPMAALYCLIHFGKPMGECISSIFGGYLLGVFAYYSRSIWGGIIVHMGIAFMMDLAALLAWFLKS
ncbi:MAG: CPBP family intramembrane metalloprotease, partial [Saprospiraceae bacterium]|nr:CPBP family intramembrane metalloprotease [Saprospiraceae bacterium]